MSSLSKKSRQDVAYAKKNVSGKAFQTSFTCKNKKEMASGTTTKHTYRVLDETAWGPSKMLEVVADHDTCYVIAQS